MTLPKPEAILFDWDDTIVDNFDVAVESLNAALIHMDMAPWSHAEVRRRSGLSGRDLFTNLFGDRWEEADRVYYDTFKILAPQRTSLFPLVEEILGFLQRQGVYMAVVSNKRGQLLRDEVSARGLQKYFGAIVGAGDAEADKPEAAPLLLALEGRGISPSPAVWYVGDSHTDMIAAIRAGCTPVLIETRLPPEDLLIKNQPARRVKNHTDLMECIRGHLS